MTEVKVSAIVSTYNAEKFFRSRIENLLNQTLGDQLEIIVIDSGSSQNEGGILQEFLERTATGRNRSAQIKYVRTNRETLYASWNRGIELAEGKYISNANTDDRLIDSALEKMAQMLDQNASAPLVYSDGWETTDENDIINCAKLEYKPGRRRLYKPDFSHNKLLLHSFVGPFPMWRREIHEQIGYFDDNFVVSGDWEFWLRMAEHAPFVHIAEPLGLMLTRDDSIVWSNQEKMLEENNTIRLKYFGNRKSSNNE